MLRVVWPDPSKYFFSLVLTNAHFFSRKAGALPLRNQVTLVLVVKALIISYS